MKTLLFEPVPKSIRGSPYCLVEVPGIHGKLVNDKIIKNHLQTIRNLSKHKRGGQHCRERLKPNRVGHRCRIKTNYSANS